MAIWLGDGGGMRLERMVSEQVYAYITPADIDTGSRRFGLDRVKQSFITGDLVSIRRVDESGQPVTDPLDFVSAAGWPDNRVYSDGQWYLNVDPIGGIRLFTSWEESLQGNSAKAVPLVDIAAGYRISLQTVQTEGARCLHQTKSWELNTNRDVADISNLGDGFRKNMAVMVSGSGSLECIFDALPDACGEDARHERSVYLHQLALRLEIGAQFTGVFLLKRGGTLPITVEEVYRPRELFYLCDCVISQVACEVTPDEIIMSTIDFVTTGEIKLIYSQPVAYLLQEQPPRDRILQESEFGIALETID